MEDEMKKIMFAALLAATAESGATIPNPEASGVVARYAPSLAPTEFYIERMSNGELWQHIPSAGLIFGCGATFVPPGSEGFPTDLEIAGPGRIVRIPFYCALHLRRDMTEENLIVHLQDAFGCDINVTRYR
jgi:hypothetical protein